MFCFVVTTTLLYSLWTMLGCAVHCDWLKYRGFSSVRNANIVFVPKSNGSCPTRSSNFGKFYGGNIQAIIDMCNTGSNTMSWLITKYGLKTFFYWSAALTSAVIDAQNKPNDVALKPLGNFTYDTSSFVLYCMVWFSDFYLLFFCSIVKSCTLIPKANCWRNMAGR